MTSTHPPGGAPTADQAQRQLALVFLPALAVFAACLADPTIFVDGDTNWHVAVGRWILAHRAVPHVDLFSYTFAGKPWVADEWGSEALFGAAYLALGWSGVALVTAVAMAVTIATIAVETAPRLPLLAATASVALPFATIWPMLLARPHILALPALALWVAGLLRARRAGRTPALWLLAVMLVWANLHGSYLFGVVLVGVFGLEAALDAPGRRLATLLRWAVFGVAAWAVAGLTPNGLDGLISPFRKLGMGSLGVIGEWKPADFSKPSLFEACLMLTVFVLVWRGVRLNAVRTGLLLLMLAMALQHVRYESLLAVTAAMLLASPLGRALTPDAPETAPPLWRAAARDVTAPLAVIALLFLGLAVWRAAWPVVRTENRATPIAALAHVPPVLAAQPVFNSYDFGGWLVFNGVRDFIDGRNDMYGDAFMRNYLAVERDADPPAVTATFTRWKIAWVILPPGARLGQLLDRTPGWRRLY
ncbi:MAG TPA: hypothetical protein VME40_06050, partial [Caulobacteraceae bacterium]|nr:hypothetical protein [Caulobacteraceae bacterium]